MSRIGRQQINLPESVSLEVSDDMVNVSGPKGNLSQPLFDGFTISQANGVVMIEKKVENAETQRYYGLLRTLINNMVVGVSEGFSKTLEVNGVGFKTQMDGGNLVMSLGFSHKITFTPPEGVEIKVQGNQITVSGFDKQRVGEVAAKIRAYKKPEPYKGKGIKYSGEVIRRKAGKTAAKG